MTVAEFHIDDLLDPISSEQPAGVDLRWAPEWDRIKEARRSDDQLASGKWAKKESKSADWRLTQELAMSLLRDRSKDLQLAMWLTEANIKLHGFAGLRDGLKTARELMIRYWDKGLYPKMEDGAEDRAGPLVWLNDKLVESIRAIPITARADQGRDYSLTDLEDARRTGSEASCRTAHGDIDENKKRDYDEALAAGHVSMEMFERALKETKRSSCEELHSTFQAAYQEFTAFDKLVDEKFGDAAPALSACRTALNDIKQAIFDILEKVRLAEPDPKSGAKAKPTTERSSEQGVRSSANTAEPLVVRFPLSSPSVIESQPATGTSWQEAENLVRSGDIEKGLVEMRRLAAGETTGRSRFQRKLLLAEVCLANQREFLARSILEELAEQIDKLQLELWESSELISRVWSRLYKLYKRGNDAADLERAAKLYQRLCRLDPWQALGCGEE